MDIVAPERNKLKSLQRRYDRALTRRNVADSHAQLAANALRTATLGGDVAGRVAMAKAYHLASLARDTAEREVAAVLAEVDELVAAELAAVDAITGQEARHEAA